MSQWNRVNWNWKGNFSIAFDCEIKLAKKNLFSRFVGRWNHLRRQTDVIKSHSIVMEAVKMELNFIAKQLPLRHAERFTRVQKSHSRLQILPPSLAVTQIITREWDLFCFLKFIKSTTRGFLRKWKTNECWEHLQHTERLCCRDLGIAPARILPASTVEMEKRITKASTNWVAFHLAFIKGDKNSLTVNIPYDDSTTQIKSWTSL